MVQRDDFDQNRKLKEKYKIILFNHSPIIFFLFHFNRCTVKSACQKATTSSPRWLAYGSGQQCIDFEQVLPDRIPIAQTAVVSLCLYRISIFVKKNIFFPFSLLCESMNKCVCFLKDSHIFLDSLKKESKKRENRIENIYTFIPSRYKLCNECPSI